MIGIGIGSSHFPSDKVVSIGRVGAGDGLGVACGVGEGVSKVDVTTDVISRVGIGVGT